MDGMLRAFRTKTATELGQPAYCVFSNKELDALVAARPQSLVDLRNVPGFGPAKIQKFGAAIVAICARHEPAPSVASSFSWAAPQRAAALPLVKSTATVGEATDLGAALRAFRTNTASGLGQPAYCVFSNKELDALVAARPQSLVDLRNVPGFGPAKIQKFGDEIIRIVCAMPAPASGSSVGAVPEMPSISGKRKLPAAFGGANAQPPTPPLPAPPSVTIPRTALNEEQRSAADRVLVGENCFLTGAAGTGKSFLLRYIIQQLEARHPGGVAVTAPTGMAASHVQGVTIHSWAGFGLGKGTISKLVDKVTSNATACQRWSRAHALLIDEVSMLDSHLFDALDAIGRAVRPDGTHLPFGGLQLILCGDFFQ